MPTTWILGLAGLLPMVAGLLAPLSAAPAALHEAVLLYGGVIAGFMAGTHWGLALHAGEGQGRDLRLMVSVIPALLAWLALLLAPRMAALALVGLFALLYAIDASLGRRGLIDRDYWRLRQILSAGAALCYFGIALSP